MGRSFLVLMIGLALALFGFEGGRFEVLLNLAGFLLIAYSAHQLSQYTLKFAISRNLSFPLIGLTLLRFFLSAKAGAVLFLFNSILVIILVWFLLAAVMRFTDERERPDLAKAALRYRRIYLGVALAAFLFRLAALFEPESARDFVWLMSVAMIVVLVLLLRLLYVVRGEALRSI